MSTSATLNCLCPADSPIKTLAKLSNNLTLIFKTMSFGKWTGQLVGLDDCGCTQAQILQAINSNLASFFSWFSANAAQNVQAGVIDLANGVSSQAVVFPTAYGAPPAVFAMVAAPDNTGFVIDASADGGNITGAGFTAMFGASTPSVGFKLIWLATPRT